MWVHGIWNFYGPSFRLGLCESFACTCAFEEDLCFRTFAICFLTVGVDCFNEGSVVKIAF